MELPEKRKRFFECFVPFLKSASNFEHFGEKDDCHSYCISVITHCERLV